MKIQIILSLFALIVLSAAEKLSPEEEEKLFVDYAKKFNIRITKFNGMKKQNFIKNYYAVQENNEAFQNGSKSFEMEINEFSHLSRDEFFATYTGYVPGSLNATLSPFNVTRQGRMNPPGSWNWNDKDNVIGPATHQGGCGSCTIFAVIGVMEAHMRIWYGIDTKLSEQEALPCCGGCGGGTNTNIYDYAREKGATNGNNFPYQGRVTESCNTNRPRVQGSKVVGHHRIQRGANAERDGIWHLANVGPLATGLCVPNSFGGYKSGVFDDENKDNCGWHAVMIVGYGTENGKPYWLIRNSWGAGWGDNGFMKFARGKNLCWFENDFTFPNMGW